MASSIKLSSTARCARVVDRQKAATAIQSVSKARGEAQKRMIGAEECDGAGSKRIGIEMSANEACNCIVDLVLEAYVCVFRIH